NQVVCLFTLSLYGGRVEQSLGGFAATKTVNNVCPNRQQFPARSGHQLVSILLRIAPSEGAFAYAIQSFKYDKKRHCCSPSVAVCLIDLTLVQVLPSDGNRYD